MASLATWLAFREWRPDMDAELRALGVMREVISHETSDHIYSPEEARAILAEAGMSYESAAKILGCSGRSIAGWLAGEHAPSPVYSDRYFKLLTVLTRANAVRSGRLAEGVNRLLEVVRSTPVPTYSESAA